MKRPTDWLGGAAPLNEYRCLNREERHITATLYSLMLTDRVGLHVLLEEVCGVPCAHGEAEEAAVWFEFTFLHQRCQSDNVSSCKQHQVLLSCRLPGRLVVKMPKSARAHSLAAQDGADGLIQRGVPPCEDGLRHLVELNLSRPR